MIKISWIEKWFLFKLINILKENKPKKGKFSISSISLISNINLILKKLDNILTCEWDRPK